MVKALLSLGNYNWSLYRIEDAINLCDLFITTTARTMSFQDRQQTVSEKYDLLVITPDKAQWIRRNSIEL